MKQPQTEISKQMKQEKDQEKLTEKGKVMELERFERKKSWKKVAEEEDEGRVRKSIKFGWKTGK